MKFLKQLAGALDSEVSTFTKILQRKRGMQTGPDGSAQGAMYRLGLDAAGSAMSPEATLAIALKEWASLQRWPVDTQIPLLEARAMGNKVVAPDSIISIDEWLAWRLPIAFPNHSFSKEDGWSDDFYRWACNRALEHFSTSPR